MRSPSVARIALSAALLLASCRDGSPGTRQNEEETLFHNVCARCHGPDGTGGPPDSLGNPGPKNFTDQAFQRSMTDAQMRNAIENGNRGMPAFGAALTPAQITLMIAHIRKLDSSAKVAANGASTSAITRLGANRLSPLAYGRASDLMLENKPFGVLTFATNPDTAGHRPLRGALVDVGTDGTDRSDPLVAWRPGWRERGAAGKVHAGPMDTVNEVDCGAPGRGIHLGGVVDGVRLDTSVCPSASGYRATTTARDLPEGATLVDDVNAGTAHVLTEGGGAQGEESHASSFFATFDDGVSWLVESPQMRVTGAVTHIGEETFQGPFTLEYGASGASVGRNFRVVAGDAFALLAQIVVSQPRSVHVGIEREAGSVALRDATGKAIALAPFTASGRDLVLPGGVGTDLAIYDDDGILAGQATLDGSLKTLIAKPPARAALSLHYTDAAGAPLPVHVMFRGQGGTRDPSPVARPGTHAFAGGRSLYLVDGTGTLALPPGKYRVTATHGIRYTLAVSEIELGAGETRALSATLRDVLAGASWTSGDFHLHAAPSPDAPVSLDARVATLVCEGLDLAVATDHNRVTDYRPSVDRLGVASRIVTVPGDEITSYGTRKWGHFNAYPLPIPPAGEAPEEGALPYFDVLPEKLFAAAHAGDAGRVVQVNHPRMPPSIGYFDLIHLDTKTGASDDAFSANFDAIEVFNGFWMTNPARVREGATDLVTLARRGVHVAATGNSDSHHVLYEEAGYPRTYVHVAPDPIATRKERVLAAIRRRDTTVSSGPLVEMTVDGAPIGSVVVPKHGHDVRVHVRVSAPAWVPVEHVEVWHDDQVAFRVDVTKSPVDGVRYEGDTVVSFPLDGTILAWATADSPLPDVLPYPDARATGFTGLVYVDADGDGKVDVPPGR